jgi:2-methylisocitrate lyase-like PEP mutase family enzyme
MRYGFGALAVGNGCKALTTTSAGMAFARGRADGAVSPDCVLQNCHDLVTATLLPVSADLNKGFGDSPESVAETIVAAVQTGLAGCSIEEYTGNPDAPIFDETLAVERIVAAVETTRQASQ